MLCFLGSALGFAISGLDCVCLSHELPVLRVSVIPVAFAIKHLRVQIDPDHSLDRRLLRSGRCSRRPSRRRDRCSRLGRWCGRCRGRRCADGHHRRDLFDRVLGDSRLRQIGDRRVRTPRNDLLAVAGPMPGSASRSASDAVLRFTGCQRSGLGRDFDIVSPRAAVAIGYLRQSRAAQRPRRTTCSLGARRGICSHPAVRRRTDPETGLFPLDLPRHLPDFRRSPLED